MHAVGLDKVVDRPWPPTHWAAGYCCGEVSGENEIREILDEI